MKCPKCDAEIRERGPGSIRGCIESTPDGGLNWRNAETQWTCGSWRDEGGEFTQTDDCLIAELRQQLAASQAENERLWAIVDRLPKDRNGNPVSFGQRVIGPCGHVNEARFRGGTGIYCCQGSCYDSGCQGDDGSGTHYDVSKCESAEAARAVGGEQ